MRMKLSRMSVEGKKGEGNSIVLTYLLHTSMYQAIRPGVDELTSGEISKAS